VAQPHRLEPVEDEAAVIREAFDAYGSGRLSSHAAVAADLNRRGIARRGKPWSKQSVRDIFRRAPFYAGQAVYRRGKDERPGLHGRSSPPSSASSPSASRDGNAGAASRPPGIAPGPCTASPTAAPASVERGARRKYGRAVASGATTAAPAAWAAPAIHQAPEPSLARHS